MQTGRNEIRPQAGPQTQFLGSSADIVIYGGSAGGGKTFGLLLEAIRHIGNSKFGAVIFRRTFPQVTNEGGLWDTSEELYPLLGAEPKELSWVFPSGAKIKFAHMQHEKTKYDWQGTQIPLICFDELTHFSETQFFYMLSRNRSTCGVKPYIRATCNPDPDSWVAKFISWWIGDDGYAIVERSGKVRYFIRISGEIIWANSREELIRDYPGSVPKSVTFILSTLYDNKILLEKDPGYLANLMAQDLVERERLLGDPQRGGNWKIRPEAGKVFNRSWFEIIPAAPAGGVTVRFYDFAATEKKLKGDDPDWTVGLKMRYVNDIFYILDVVRMRASPTDVDNTVKNTASQDGVGVPIRWEEEGGASGKRDSSYLTRLLVGYDAYGIHPTQDKVLRAKPLAAQARAGNVKLVEGDWNEDFLKELHNQPDWGHDDQMDAASGAFNAITSSDELEELDDELTETLMNYRGR